MKSANVIYEAQIDPALKKYLLVQNCVIVASTIFGIILIPLLIVPISRLVNRYYNTIKVRLTERSLIVNKGVLVRVEKTIPLERITDLALVQGPLMRYFNLYALRVETAGSSSPQGADASIYGVVAPKHFRKIVLQQVEIVEDRPRSKDAEAVDIDAEERPDTMTEIRDTLLRIERILERDRQPVDHDPTA